MNRWRLLAFLPLLAAAGCEQKFIEAQPPLEPLPPAGAQEGIAAPRVNGPVGTAAGTPAALTSTAAFETLRQPPPERRQAWVRSRLISRTPTFARSRPRSSAASCTSTSPSIRR